MAFNRSVQDGAMGCIPMRTPLQSEIRKFIVTNGVTLYPGQPVLIVAATGAVSAYASGMEVTGICLEYCVGDGTKEVSVCISPDMTYKILGDDNYGDTAYIGYLCDFVDPDAANTSTKMSKAVANTDSAVATTGTIGANDCIRIMGKVDAESNATETADWFEIKFHTMTFDLAFTA